MYIEPQGMPIDGPAPALVNAMNAALGTRIACVPALPEVVLEQLGPAGVACTSR